ncbi:acyl carrier protein [Bacillus infantis]|nr:phosphopantetheine-binding protein [Bacillus infantis]
MDKNTVKSRVLCCLKENGLTYSPVEDNQLLFKEIDDSLMMIKLAIEIENEFNIELDWEELEPGPQHNATLENLVDHIKDLIS